MQPEFKVDCVLRRGFPLDAMREQSVSQRIPACTPSRDSHLCIGAIDIARVDAGKDEPVVAMLEGGDTSVQNRTDSIRKVHAFCLDPGQMNGIISGSPTAKCDASSLKGCVPRCCWIVSHKPEKRRHELRLQTLQAQVQDSEGERDRLPPSPSYPPRISCPTAGAPFARRQELCSQKGAAASVSASSEM